MATYEPLWKFFLSKPSIQTGKQTRYTPFTPFVNGPSEQATNIAHELSRSLRRGGISLLVKAATQFQESYPDSLVHHAVMLVLTHDPKAREYSGSIPPLLTRFPEIAARSQPNSGGESEMDWFREDPFMNEHHEHWHVVYPNTGTRLPGDRAPSLRDRQGELFLYMHQQMLARYNAERFALGLEAVVPYWDFRKPIEEGYAPTGGLEAHFDSRLPGTCPTDLSIPGAWDYAIRDHEARMLRLDEAIERGRILAPSHDLDLALDVDLLGAVMECSTGTIGGNRHPLTYFGNYHGLGHVLVAMINQPTSPFPDESNGVRPGVMWDTATSMRDPVFYRWHRHIDSFYERFTSRQSQQTFGDRPEVKIRKRITPAKDEVSLGEADSSDIIIRRERDIPEDAMADLATYGEQTFGGSLWDAEHPSDNFYTAMEDRRVGDTVVSHLVHDDFVMFIRLENRLFKHQAVTVRVFLAPRAASATGWAWFQLDKFVHELGPKQRAVVPRRGRESVVVRQPAVMRRDAAPEPPPSNPNGFCGCGWPYHMLIPRGAEGGQKFRMMVLVSDWDIDRASDDGCCGSLVYCGAIDKYPDKRPMLYPFDRPWRHSIEDTVMTNPNMAIKDVDVVHRTVVQNKRDET